MVRRQLTSTRHALLMLPQDLSEWACIYIRYIQILRKLETAYDQMVHPQKRLDMRKALEACIGRTLEIRHWMVKLNRGLDFVSLDDILVDLKLTPEVLEIPVPKYFIEDRAKELDDRDKFLEALVEKYNVKPPQPSPIMKIGAPLPEEEAIALIQKNERGEAQAAGLSRGGKEVSRGWSARGGSGFLQRASGFKGARNCR